MVLSKTASEKQIPQIGDDRRRVAAHGCKKSIGVDDARVEELREAV
jgi:hypothetical protein